MNMSKLLISAATHLIAANSFAQGGPTKEQTIDYIQAGYTGGIEYQVSQGYSEPFRFYNAGGDVKNLKLTIVGSQVEFNYHLTTWTNHVDADGISPRVYGKDELTTTRFDMKDIESIEGGVFNQWMGGIIVYEHADDGGGILYLIFATQNDKKLITVVRNGVSEQVSSVWVPFNVDNVKTGHRALQELKQTQLYKAFEHLRKLSGGPEPVRF